MSKKTFTKFVIHAPIDKVMAALTNRDFEMEQQTAHKATKSAEIEEVSRSEEKLELKIHCVEYAKGVTGINYKKTENTVTDMNWDLKANKGSWVYHSTHGDKVHIWGYTQATAKGEETEIYAELNAEIKLPLVGGKIEKMIVKEADAFWPTYQSLIEKWVQKV